MGRWLNGGAGGRLKAAVVRGEPARRAPDPSERCGAHGAGGLSGTGGAGPAGPARLLRPVGGGRGRASGFVQVDGDRGHGRDEGRRARGADGGGLMAGRKWEPWEDAILMTADLSKIDTLERTREAITKRRVLILAPAPPRSLPSPCRVLGRPLGKKSFGF